MQPAKGNERIDNFISIIPYYPTNVLQTSMFAFNSAICIQICVFCYSISDFAIVKWSFAEKSCSSYFIWNIYLKIQNDSIKRNSILYRFNQHFLISAFICPSYDQKLNNIFFTQLHILFDTYQILRIAFEINIASNFVFLLTSYFFELRKNHFKWLTQSNFPPLWW